MSWKMPSRTREQLKVSESHYSTHDQVLASQWVLGPQPSSSPSVPRGWWSLSGRRPSQWRSSRPRGFLALSATDQMEATKTGVIRTDWAEISDCAWLIFLCCHFLYINKSHPFYLPKWLCMYGKLLGIWCLTKKKCNSESCHCCCCSVYVCDLEKSWKWCALIYPVQILKFIADLFLVPLHSLCILHSPQFPILC